MDDVRGSWKEVASQVEALGLKLKLHLEQEQDAEVAERAVGETSTAFNELQGKVTDAFEAFGAAAKDEAVQADVRNVAELIKDALVDTFRAAGAEIEQLMGQIEGYADQAADKLGGADSKLPETVEIKAEKVQDTIADAGDAVTDAVDEAGDA